MIVEAVRMFCVVENLAQQRRVPIFGKFSDYAREFGTSGVDALGVKILNEILNLLCALTT